MPIPKSAKEVTFKVKLAAGITTLAPLFIMMRSRLLPFMPMSLVRLGRVEHRPGNGYSVYDPTHGAVPPQMKDQDRVNYNRQKKKTSHTGSFCLMNLLFLGLRLCLRMHRIYLPTFAIKDRAVALVSVITHRFSSPIR